MPNRLYITALLLLSSPLLAHEAVVNSHEYKLLLNPELFSGNTEIRATSVSRYWDQLEKLIENGSIERETSGNLSLKKSRRIIFYDVEKSCDLFNAGYIFRERINNGKREVTLKYRSTDKLIASRKNMEGSKSKNKSKFEEDLAAPFTSKYSYSTKQKVGKNKNLNKLRDAIKLYPGLANENFDGSLPLKKVGNLTVSEYLYKKAYVDLGALESQFSLTLWYNETVSTTLPITAEISFKYKNKNKGSGNKVAARSKSLFQAMQKDPRVAVWNTKNSLSKTATVYQYDNTFCD